MITSRKQFPVRMPPACWKLLGMYAVIINYKLVKREWPQLQLPRIVGAMLGHFLINNEERIQDEFRRIQAEVAQMAIPKFHSSRQLEELANADGPEVPELLRIGWRGRQRRDKDAKISRRVCRLVTDNLGWHGATDALTVPDLRGASRSGQGEERPPTQRSGPLPDADQ